MHLDDEQTSFRDVGFLELPSFWMIRVGRTWSLRNTPSSKATPTAPHTPSPRHGTPTTASLRRTNTLCDEPESPVKDLSELFNFTDLRQKRPGLSPRPSGVAKRMHPLRRTQTDSSVVPASPSVNERLRHTPRKLSGTRTDSIIDLTYSSTGSGATNTPEAGPSRSRPLTPHKDHTYHADDSSPAIRPSLTHSATTSVRTYAGKSRSFLVALPMSQMPSLSNGPGGSSHAHDFLGGSQEEEFDMRESYNTLRQRYGVDNSEDDPMPPPEAESLSESPNRKGKGKAPVVIERLPEGMMNDLKSISELRSKGEARRFLDEVGYLFEGLDPEGTIGVRRGSALEIVSKLCDVEFARRAQAADFLSKAWEMLRVAGAGDPEGDKVLNTIFTFFSALVAKDESDLAALALSLQTPESHSTSNELVTVLCGMLAKLTCDNDPLWLTSAGLDDAEMKKAGIGKGDKAAVGFYNPISNRLLMSFTLSRLPAGSIPIQNLSSLLGSLVGELACLPSRISAYTAGLHLLQPLSASSYKESPSLAHIDNCLRLLDEILLHRWDDDDDDPDGDPQHGRKNRAFLDRAKDKGLARALVSLCVVTDLLERESRHVDKRDGVEKCMQSAIRVLINLTHDSLPWCEAVLEEPSAITTVVRLIITAQVQRQRIDTAVKVKRESQDTILSQDSLQAAGEMGEDVAEDDTSAQLLDRLCLALGLLTNLVQGTPEAKKLIGNTLLSIHCKGKRSCIPACTCASRTDALECLAHVYTQLCRSGNQFDTVIRGHVAVLFGLLMQDSSRNQQTLLRTLPGATIGRKLHSLLENAKDFTAFYMRFSQRAAEAVNERPHEHEDAGQDQDYAEEDERSGERTDMRLDRGIQGVLHDGKGEDVAKNVISFLEALQTRISSTDTS
ncbi:hypothetical protein NM688_g1032 [Phlebia brevispora]|uniref:Uncharacterized protein n=1 Tax=Phlebia brevispora TaxID=194682 RepID=A0ACC1TCA6_9APHY|nr:hypothetical protein NM688_g1032 [Phlebia brevispora]